MNTEDQLREILHRHAETITPTGDGLQVIQERIDRRRSRRWLTPAVGSLITASLAVMFVLQLGPEGRRDVVLNPGNPSVAPSMAPTTTPPTPPPYVGPVYEGPAIWPFRSLAEAGSWDSSGPQAWAAQPITTTEHFLSDYLKLSGVEVTAPKSFIPSGPLRFSTQLSVGQRSVGRVELAKYGPDGPWTVISVGGTDLTVTSPEPGDRVASPHTVTGRVTGVDENIRLELITFSGLLIATAFAPAGSEVPWDGSLAWTAEGWTSATIIGTTRSFKDGSLTRLVAVPVLPR